MFLSYIDILQTVETFLNEAKGLLARMFKTTAGDYLTKQGA